MLTWAEIRWRRTWLVAVMLAVALLTASAAPWKWQFVALYVAIAFLVGLPARSKNENTETLIQVAILAGSVPFTVRTCFGDELGILGTVHVGAVLAVSTGVGHLLAGSIRSRQTLTDYHTG